MEATVHCIQQRNQVATTLETRVKLGLFRP